MAASARGRGGRGRGRDLGVTPRKPGSGQAQGSSGPARTPKIPSTVKELGTYLRSLNDTNLQLYCGAFTDMVLGYSTNERRLQEAVDLLFETTVSNREHAELGAKICAGIAMSPAGGSEEESKSAIRANFLKALLGRFQTEYKKKEETRENSIETWLTIFSFLCEVYIRIKIGNEPIKVIGKAILSTIEYFFNLPDIDDDEVEAVCTYLKLCGKHLDALNQPQIEKLIVKLRSMVISKKSSCRTRCLAMEVLEFRCMGWSDPHKRLDDFYVDALVDALAKDELGDTS